MNALVSEELTIESTPSSDICLVWKGKSNAREPWSHMKAYFEEIARMAEQRGVDVEMHFEDLEYFNSSTITAIIRIMQLLQAKNVRLKLMFDEALRWQKLSFDGLRIFEKPDGMFKLHAVER